VTPGELLLIVGMAIAVYLPKGLPLVLISESLVARLHRWLQYVAPAVLGALVAPSIIAPRRSPRRSRLGPGPLPGSLRSRHPHPPHAPVSGRGHARSRPGRHAPP